MCLPWYIKAQQWCGSVVHDWTRISLVISAANERRRYIVTSPLIGCAQTQNNPLWSIYIYIYIYILNTNKPNQTLTQNVCWMLCNVLSYRNPIVFNCVCRLMIILHVTRPCIYDFALGIQYFIIDKMEHYTSLCMPNGTYVLCITI